MELVIETIVMFGVLWNAVLQTKWYLDDKNSKHNVYDPPIIKEY